MSRWRTQSDIALHAMLAKFLTGSVLWRETEVSQRVWMSGERRISQALFAELRGRGFVERTGVRNGYEMWQLSSLGLQTARKWHEAEGDRG